MLPLRAHPSSFAPPSPCHSSHLVFPPGMALNALTVTLPERSGLVNASSGGSGGSGGSIGSESIGSKLLTAWSSTPPVASTTACAPSMPQQRQQRQHQQQGNTWGSGTTSSKAEGGVEYQLHQTTSPFPLSPPPSLAVSSTSSRTPTSPIPHGRTTTGGDRVIAQEIERETDGEDAHTAASAASYRGNLTARETSHHMGVPPLPAAQTKESRDSIDTAIATATPTQQQQQQQEKKQRYRGLRSQMPLSSLFSSPSLLCGKRSTRQNKEGKPLGGRSGDDEAKYRSICSCPAIGAMDECPLFTRHELTDRSASERSQRLVSVGSSIDSFVLIIVRRRYGCTPRRPDVSSTCWGQGFHEQ